MTTAFAPAPNDPAPTMSAQEIPAGPSLCQKSGRLTVNEDALDGLTLDLQAVARDRDRLAFGRLFDHFGPRLKAMFMRSAMIEASAEDLVQDVMLTVWHKAGQFDPHRATPASWIYAIARNRRIDQSRRRPLSQIEDIPDVESLEPDAVQIIALRQETEHLTAALTRLSPEQSQMLRAAYFDDIPHSGISERTGLPLGTIKSRIRLGLARLRHELRKISQ